MTARRQHTIERPCEVSGISLFGSRDARITFLPAPEFHGIAFYRTDLGIERRIPALGTYIVPGSRRTILKKGPASVEVVEHILAALAGLQIDNCLIQIDGPEPPGMDGSAQPFVAALLDAGIVPQSARRRVCDVSVTDTIQHTNSSGTINIAPPSDGGLKIRFELDYTGTVIGKQSREFTITPDIFVNEIAGARTFILESDITLLRAAGYGLNATPKSLLVFGDAGPIDNALRTPDECVRHKILDCVGDFALLGCDITGTFHCTQSGHALNHDVVRRLDRQLWQSEDRRRAG